MIEIGRRELIEASLAMAGMSTLGLAQNNRPREPIIAPPGHTRVETGGPFVFKISSADTAGRYSIIESGAVAPPLHRHLHQDEWFYVVQGEFGFQVGERRFKLAAGGSVLGPRGSPHAFVGLQGASRLLIMYEPAGMMEGLFKELSSLMLNGRLPSLDRIAAVNRKYGLESVGPPLTADGFG
jgi:quercetin 2,3-dioxygenase